MISLGGPTHFYPLLKQFYHYIKDIHQMYFVLLILTDGIINDMPATKDAIVKLSALPCSIIIVGVGNAAFDAMGEIAGDEYGILKDSEGKARERDIVQFVSYNKMM